MHLTLPRQGSMLSRPDGGVLLVSTCEMRQRRHAEDAYVGLVKNRTKN